MPTLIDDLLIRDTSKPGKLRIADAFGKETSAYSVGGDLTWRLYADPQKQISGSFVIKSNADAEVFRFKENGEIQISQRPSQQINPIKNYTIPVVDEVGFMRHVQISGAKLLKILA